MEIEQRRGVSGLLLQCSAETRTAIRDLDIENSEHSVRLSFDGKLNFWMNLIQNRQIELSDHKFRYN